MGMKQDNKKEWIKPSVILRVPIFLIVHLLRGSVSQRLLSPEQPIRIPNSRRGGRRRAAAVGIVPTPIHAARQGKFQRKHSQVSPSVPMVGIGFSSMRRPSAGTNRSLSSIASGTASPRNSPICDVLSRRMPILIMLSGFFCCANAARNCACIAPATFATRCVARCKSTRCSGHFAASMARVAGGGDAAGHAR